MKAIIAAIAIIIAPTISKAGDPCPIPVNIVDLGVPSWLDRNALLEQISSQQSWIGIQHRDTPQGIVLSQIYDQSPAAAAGLQEGDLVTAINDVSTVDVAAREALFDAASIGDTLTFSLFNGSDITLMVGRADPVAMGMMQTLRRQDCRASDIRTPDLQQQALLLPLLFNPNRSFRCEEAHQALEFLGERFEIDDVYMVRGSRRILLTMPYWGTTCITAASVDGDNLTDAALLAALDDVIGDYVQDQIDNP